MFKYEYVYVSIFSNKAMVSTQIQQQRKSP